MTPKTVLDFWNAAGPDKWFAKDAVFDGAMSIHFRSALAEARAGAFDGWAETPRGALALVILLDQFSRNLHRGSPLAFAGDRKALALAKRSIGRGDRFAMPAPEGMWIVMPFEHSEVLDDQERAIGHFTVMGLAEMVHYAAIHRDIIARFGRFPHRNAVLARRSTPAEIAFLAAGGFSG